MKLSVVWASSLFASFASAFQTSVHGPQHAAHTVRLQPLFSTIARSTIDISETAQRDIYSMQEWATNCGVQTSDGFELTTDHGHGHDYHVVTNTALAAGSPVVFVPNQMILSSFGAAQEFGAALGEAENKLAQANMSYLIPLFRLFVKILAEYDKGEDSPYFPWLNSLPRIFYNGASMTCKCILPKISIG